MVKTTRNYLRVVSDQSPEVVRPEIEGLTSLPAILSAFERATGWSLRYISDAESKRLTDLTWTTPVNPGVGATLGHLTLGQSSLPVKLLEDEAQDLASAVGGMLSELLQSHHTLWRREAELVTCVPVVTADDDGTHLAERLEAVLRGGAEAVDCQAAALYLLDDDTTKLKLRSCWGLPRTRLAEPARQLQGAMADLEAMLGHAVVIENAELMERWNIPEDFPSAVCVPISSPTTILGTLWVFCDRKRDFTPKETNLIEVVAGRLVADLEREVLVSEGSNAAGLKQQVVAAERLQRGGLPTIAPVLDGWEMAGWTAQAESVGGGFYDWFCLPDDLLCLALGDAKDRGIGAAMLAGIVKTATRCHSQYTRNTDLLLKNVNLTLWTGSAGDQSSSLFCGMVDTSTGMTHFSSAGNLSVVLVRQDGWYSFTAPTSALGVGPEADYEQADYLLKPGESIVIFSGGVRDSIDHRGRPLGESSLVKALADRHDLTASEMVELAQDRLAAHAVFPENEDRTVLVIKRTEP